MKWIKRILAALVVLILLFVIAAAVLIATFDPNVYKERVEQAVEQSTGRELALQGDIQLSFFPWLGIKLGAARLGNAKGFGNEPFASVDNVQVRVKLLPLFRGKIRADTVRFQGLEANLSKNAQGVSNWQDLIKSTGKQAPPAKAKQPRPGQNLALAVGGIDIENAALHWRNAQTGQDIRIAPIDLTTGAFAFGKPLDIDLSLHLKNAKPAVAADLNLTGAATVNPDTQRYVLADTKLTVNATGEQLPKDGVEATLKAAMDANLKAGTAAVQPLTLEIADLRLTGQATATGLNSERHVQGELKSDPFNPRKLLQALGQEPPATRDPKVFNNANVKLAFSATQNSAQLSQLEMQFDDTRLNGQGAVESFNKPKITFTAALDTINLDRYQLPAAEAKPAPAKKPAPPADQRLPLPVETLRDLYVDGRLTAGKLKASGLNFTDVNATVTARDGVVKISPLALKLYQGSLKSNANMNVRGDIPEFTVDSALDGVQAGALLTELAGDDYLTGATRLTLDLKTRGRTISILKRALNGNLAVSFKDGSLTNSKLAGYIARAVAFFKGQPSAASATETRFTSLTGSGQIVRGILNSNNLTLVSPTILAKGQGSVNIPQSTVAYTLDVALNDAGKPKDNRYVPLEINGPFSDLGYKLALSDVVKEQAQQALEKELKSTQQELKSKEQELKQKLQDKLQQQLKDGFNF
jgi:AsmA protein